MAVQEDNMRVCCCSLAGTKACDFCINNGGTYSKSVTTTYKIPEENNLSKEDYKEILKYLIDKFGK